MADEVETWTPGKLLLIIFVAVLLALVAFDVLNGMIEGFRAAVTN